MGFILFIHVAACILLVITILMQAGRGGGLAESFSSAESMFGTQTNSFMVKTSTILAGIFLVTSLLLAVNGSKGNKSLMSNKELLPKTQETAKPVEDAEPKVSVQVSDPKPLEAQPESVTKPVVNAAN